MYQLKLIQKKSQNQPLIRDKFMVGQQADAVTDQGMRMTESDTIQMQPLEDDEETLQMHPVNDEHFVQMKCKKCEEEEMLQAKSHSNSESECAFSEISQQIEMLKGNGETLSPVTNQFMSNSFGNDFSGVHIHTDSNALQMNQKLGARAFTVGNDIYFNEGQYNPNSVEGKHLLAHELTHVVQQNGYIERMIQCDRVGDRETEREAERGRRRRDTEGGRDRGRRSGGDLDSDWAGRAILGRWLTGMGDWTIINNPSWTAYMMASDLLRSQLSARLRVIVNNGIRTADTLHQDTFPVYQTFSAVVENGEGIIGYQYLHGTNADVGGFVIWGEGRIISLADGQRMVILNLTYQWNDMIDPNPQYQTDSIKSIIGEIITLGQAESYAIHISWPGTATVILDSANSIITTVGYPFY
jgi:hypothetical protein